MPAYSFKAQFREPILAGRKRQTIRAPRKRGSHATPGDTVRLQSGTRFKPVLLGFSTCIGLLDVRLELEAGRVVLSSLTHGEKVSTTWARPGELDLFARLDGFGGWLELRKFWAEVHGVHDVFEGSLIEWGELRAEK